MKTVLLVTALLLMNLIAVTGEAKDQTTKATKSPHQSLGTPCCVPASLLLMFALAAVYFLRAK